MKPSAYELENYIVSTHEAALSGPEKALQLFKIESEQGIPTAIAKHPTGWYVIQSSGQGPYIIWDNYES